MLVDFLPNGRWVPALAASIILNWSPYPERWMSEPRLVEMCPDCSKPIRHRLDDDSDLCRSCGQGFSLHEFECDVYQDDDNRPLGCDHSGLLSGDSPEGEAGEVPYQ